MNAGGDKIIWENPKDDNLINANKFLQNMIIQFVFLLGITYAAKPQVLLQRSSAVWICTFLSIFVHQNLKFKVSQFFFSWNSSELWIFIYFSLFLLQLKPKKKKQLKYILT